MLNFRRISDQNQIVPDLVWSSAVALLFLWRVCTPLDSAETFHAGNIERDTLIFSANARPDLSFVVAVKRSSNLSQSDNVTWHDELRLTFHINMYVLCCVVNYKWECRARNGLKSPKRNEALNFRRSESSSSNVDDDFRHSEHSTYVLMFDLLQRFSSLATLSYYYYVKS